MFVIMECFSHGLSFQVFALRRDFTRGRRGDRRRLLPHLARRHRAMERKVRTTIHRIATIEVSLE